MLGVLILASGGPEEHVLPHTFFKLLNFNFNFGLDKIPILNIQFGAPTFNFTNHLLMTLVAAALCLLIFPWQARQYARMGRGPQAPRGAVNLLEAMLQFVRQGIAQPVLKERTDAFMPFLWTVFFFILFCNLLGLVPFDPAIQLMTGGKLKHVGGTATGNLAVTGGLAICAFIMIHVGGIRGVYHGLVTGTHGHHDQEEVREAGESHRGEHAQAHGQAPGKMAPAQSALYAAPLYLWGFAPHVLAPSKPRSLPGFALRIVMVPVFAIVLSVELAMIFRLLAGTGGTRPGFWVGAVLGVLAGLRAGGIHPFDVLDAAMWEFLLLLELLGAVIKPFALMIRLFANMVAGHVVLASILLLIPVVSGLASLSTGVVVSLGCVGLACLELFVGFLQTFIFAFLTTLFISMAVEPQH